MQKETFSLFYVCIVHFSLKDELYLFWKAIILEIKKCILGLPSILFILSYAYTGKYIDDCFIKLMQMIFVYTFDFI